MERLILGEKNIVNWEQNVQQEFLSQYGHFIGKYKELGITLSLQPCYFYSGKYHTQKRNSGCFIAFRIRLYPEKYTYTQARNKSLSQEFFSHKMAKIKKVSSGYQLVTYSAIDNAVNHFLKKYLSRAAMLYDQGAMPSLAIRETLGNVLRSFLYVYRYRSEVKRTYHGHSLEWIVLLLVVLLICARVYVRIKRLGS